MKQRISSLQKWCIALIDWVHTPFPKIPKETFRYGATGGFNTVLDITLFFLCYNYILDKHDIRLLFITVSPHIAAFLMVFPITFSTGFLFARYITFTESPIRGHVQLFRYILSVSGAILLNYIFLKLFVEYLNLWATIAKVFTTVIVIIYSYVIQRYYTFKTGSFSRSEQKL
ncbi:MAG: GtrA family protein [Bacteroidota bacterium]|jgi:putative flippase GtrA